MPYRVTKTYGHERGLSACFRQWRATHSHCSLLHGYSLSVELVFEAETLDERNWVVDFGGLDWIKAYLEETFDHTTLVSSDDPLLPLYEEMARMRLIKMVTVTATGCEAFSEMIFHYVNSQTDVGRGRVRIMSVKVAEHGSNSATYFRKD